MWRDFKELINVTIAIIGTLLTHGPSQAQHSRLRNSCCIN